MTRGAIASSTQLSADAGAQILADGGNAVDAAVAASLVAISTEPGVCAVGGGGYVTIHRPGSEAVTIDGNIEMPGRGVDPARLGGGAWDVTLDYGGGITTKVGHGSVGTPGALAAYDVAWTRYGSLPWAVLLEPVIDITRRGFPMSQASYNYLRFAHELVYGWHPLSHAAIHDDRGELLPIGATVRVADLPESLEHIAREGAQDLYRGDLAKLLAKDFDANDGVMTARDLAEYQPLVRQPLRTAFGPWRLASNPAPAVGGATLSAMLVLLNARPFEGWTEREAARLARITRDVLRHRFDHLDLADDPPAAVAALIDLAARGALGQRSRSADTVHTSAVDADGLACAITMSSGYGAGVMPPGTGIWMNNCLGEIELNRRGLIAGPPGTRLSSNMAPTVGVNGDQQVLSIGSPGADRITSALLQTLVNFVQLGMPLADAIAQPRLHVELLERGERVAHEPGVPVGAMDMPTRELEPLSMYFGGVGAVTVTADGRLDVGADPRRRGGHAMVD